MYIYTYTYTCIYIYMYIHIHIHLHVYTYTHIYTHIYICIVHVYRYRYICTYIYIYYILRRLILRSRLRRAAPCAGSRHAVHHCAVPWATCTRTIAYSTDSMRTATSNNGAGPAAAAGVGFPSTAEWPALSSGSKAQPTGAYRPTWPATLFRSSWRPSSTKRRNSWQSCWLHTQRSGSMTCTPERHHDMHAGAAQ